VQSIFGKELGNFMLSGVSTLPGVPIDVQGRLSMGNLIPGSGALKPNASMRDALELLGPAGGLFDEYVKGAKSVISGNPLEAAIGFSPVAIKNVLKGADVLQTGAYRDTRGRVVVEATPVDAVAKAIGFMPPTAAEAGRRERVVQELTTVYRTAKSDIAAKWAEGMFTNDSDLVEEARRDIAKWNMRNPTMPIKVDLKDVVTRVKQMRMTRAERMARTAPKDIRGLVKQQLEE
jgi:hypothetical protein